MTRNSLETAQARLAAAALDIDEIILRNRQAIRRTPLVGDVLAPAITQLEHLRTELRSAHDEINAAWQTGQARRWSE